MSRRDAPKDVGSALAEVMSAEQDLLCAYERALNLIPEGSPLYAAVEGRYSAAVGASMDTQRELFSAPGGASPSDLLGALVARQEAENPGDEPPGKPS